MSTQGQRRSRILIPAAVSASLLLAACGGGSSGSADKLEVWMPTPHGAKSTDEELAYYEEIVADFEEENDVEVTITQIPWASYEDKYLTGVSSGEGPDVGYMYNEMIGDYMENGAISAMDEYLSDEFKDNHLFLDQGVFEDEQFMIPYVVGNARVIWANLDILEDSGVEELPTDWAEFQEAAKQVADAGYEAVLQPWGEGNSGVLNQIFYPYFWQAGGELFTEDGSATAFNSEAGLEAVGFITDLMDSGAMSSDASGMDQDDVDALFLEGEIAFHFDSQSIALDVDEQDFEADFIASLTNKQQATFVANDGLVLFDAAEDKDLAAKLIETLLADEAMSKFHQEVVSYPPVTKGETADDDRFSEIYEQPDMLQSLPIQPNSAPVYNALHKNLQQVVGGSKTAEEALQDAADEGDAALQGNE